LAIGRAIAAALRLAGQPASRRMIRSLMLTPWFAFSAGIVIAASLTLVSPRAVLSFPPGAGGSCQGTGCGSTGYPRAKGPLPASRWEVKLPQVKTVPAGQHGGGAAVRKATLEQTGPVRVYYALLPGYGDHFVAVIEIVGHKALGTWTLRFFIPGTQIKLIIFAKWTPEGPDGGVASSSPWLSRRSGPDQVRIVILGTGTPAWPRGCRFDGNRCVFHALSGDSHQSGWRSHSPGQRSW